MHHLHDTHARTQVDRQASRKASKQGRTRKRGKAQDDQDLVHEEGGGSEQEKEAKDESGAAEGAERCVASVRGLEEGRGGTVVGMIRCMRFMRSNELESVQGWGEC